MFGTHSILLKPRFYSCIRALESSILRGSMSAKVSKVTTVNLYSIFDINVVAISTASHCTVLTSSFITLLVYVKWVILFVFVPLLKSAQLM